MPEALLHREQDLGVAARLDVDHSIGVQAGQAQGRSEQVPPPEAPEHLPLRAGEDAGEEYRGACVVGEVGTARYLVQRAGGYAAAGKARVERLDSEGYRAMPRTRALYPCDARTQIFEDDGLLHGIDRLMDGLTRSLFVPLKAS